MGEEKNTALLLMRKYIAFQNKQPFLIKSVIVKEGIKGYIYVEAYKQPHVKAVIEEVSSLKMGLYKQEVSIFKIRIICFNFQIALYRWYLLMKCLMYYEL